MVLIVGAGAVGTILAAYLAAAHRPVKLVIREKDVPKFETARQLTVERVGRGRPPLEVHKPALTTALDLEGIEYLLICVKFPALEDLLKQLPDKLPAGLTVVSTLNGVGALRRVRERFPDSAVAGMTVMFNGQMLEPLHARITTKPQVLIGSDDEKLLGLFGDSGMQVIRARGESAAWGKLLINLANAVCAITHTTFKDLLTDPDMRAIYAAVLDEAVGTLEHAGIHYQMPMPLPYAVYRGLLLHGGPLPWWLAKIRNGLQEGSYPSMVADVEAGRPTEVGQLNGEIVCLGQELKQPAPHNARILSLVQKMEGKAPPPYLTPAELRTRLGV
jgi:2-dehydropantoate 2-reductase